MKSCVVLSRRHTEVMLKRIYNSIAYGNVPRPIRYGGTQMGRFLIAILLACLYISPFGAIAADSEKPTEGTRLLGTFAPKTGAWSEYALFNKITGKRNVMRMSIVGVEGDSYWYEMIIKEEEGSNIVKMMVTGDPNDPENIKRIIVKSGTNKAQEMDRESMKKVRMLVSRMFEGQSGIPATLNVTLKDKETGEGVATVPAGTFDVSLHQIMDTTGTVYAKYKSSQKVRPFGIVSSDTESTSMVLIGYGNGAESLITEEPAMMNQPSAELEEIFQQMVLPDKMSSQGMGVDSGAKIRQIQGMGTGYEPEQQGK